jgi:hypothetical protein
MPLLIGIETNKQNTIRECLIKTFPVLKEKYENYKPVIKYLENTNLN